MTAASKATKKETKGDTGRRQLLVHLDVERIKRLKKAAIDLDKSASEIVDEAVLAWLDQFDRREV